MTGKNAFSLAVYSVDCVICGKIIKLKETCRIETSEYQRKQLKQTLGDTKTFHARGLVGLIL